jgi:DME family drug/metabolite transporter
MPPVKSTVRSSRLGLLLIALASIAWGTTGATMKLLAPLSPFLIGFLRLAIAAPVLFAIALWTGQWRIGSRANGLAAAGVVAALAAYQLCYFSAVPRTSVAITALLAICTAPLMVAGLARLLLGEQVTRLTVVAVGAGIAGTGLLVAGPGGARQAPEFALGALLALGAALAYAVVAVLSKRLLGQMSPYAIVGAAFPLGAGFLAPAALNPSSIAPGTGLEWGLLLYLGLIPTALAYILYLRGLTMTPATVASVVTLLEPLTATALGLLLFGERLGFVGLIGAGLLLGALALTLLAPLTRDRSGD